jgi:hypothetical protein
MPNDSPHRRTGRPRGAKLGNTKAVKHGLYRAAFVAHRELGNMALCEARALVREIRKKPDAWSPLQPIGRLPMLVYMTFA